MKRNNYKVANRLKSAKRKYLSHLNLSDPKMFWKTVGLQREIVEFLALRERMEILLPTTNLKLLF